MAAPQFTTIRYQVVDDAIARVTLNRPEKRNAQNKRLLHEVNEAFDLACQDDAIKVIVLDAEGDHFSAGHDLTDASNRAENMPDFPSVGTWGGYTLPGGEGMYAIEAELYLGLSWRWRNIPKPMIAAAQGRTIAGGLMLLWPCDIIIASDDATFCDPVVAAGVNGVEYFGHPWELGPRKAKELLFTGDSISAEEARQLGMVNRVVPRADLLDEALAMARKIATKPSFGLKLAKQSVNQAVDIQGLQAALQAAFSLQQLAHTHLQLLYGDLAADPSALNAKGLVRTTAGD
jgi:enoyl-CoA hydratase